MSFPEGLTFDDVLLVPQYSDIMSRQDVSLKTRVSRNVPLNMPLVSSNMDTVTEDKMAIAMAQNGGIGILHRYCTVDEEVNMLRKVKRAESHIIYDPYTLSEDNVIRNAKDKMSETSVGTFLIVDHENHLKGILTRRDIKYCDDNDDVKKRMTTVKNMIFSYESENITMEQAKLKMIDNKIQKLPIVDQDYKLKSLICLKDIDRIEQRPLANLDKDGRLRCGAAIGVKDEGFDRAKRLIDAGADVLVIDIAHGHSKMCIDTVKKMKEQFEDIDIVAGNIATYDGALALIKAGADGIKCGIGLGSICTTRLMAGSGVPQLTAILDAAPICHEFGVPLISDGGNRNYGNISKALAAGADCVMLGRMLAGSDESPGKVFIKDGKRVKIIRGMASYGANVANSQRQGTKEPDSITSFVEGVEGYVPYSGPVEDTLRQICNGVRSGLTYTGAYNIKELQEKKKFIRMTKNGVSESGVHDISQF